MNRMSHWEREKCWGCLSPDCDCGGCLRGFAFYKFFFFFHPMFCSWKIQPTLDTKRRIIYSLKHWNPHIHFLHNSGCCFRAISSEMRREQLHNLSVPPVPTLTIFSSLFSFSVHRIAVSLLFSRYYYGGGPFSGQLWHWQGSGMAVCGALGQMVLVRSD